MRKIGIMLCIILAMILVIASFPTVSANQKGKTEERIEAKWYPGFILVQIVKGIIALTLIILILLDIIEPEE